jgi:hypothetical protein
MKLFIQNHVTQAMVARIEKAVAVNADTHGICFVHTDCEDIKPTEQDISCSHSTGLRKKKMLTVRRFLLFGIMMFVLTGCGLFDTEIGIEKDRAEQKKILDGFFVSYWRGAKISLRSLPLDAETETIDFEEIKRQQQERLHLGKHLSRIFDWRNILQGAEQEEKRSLSATEYIELAQEVYAMADTIEKQDEDTYPTFIEILHHGSRILRTDPIEIPQNWNSSMEHWLFALVMESRFGLGSWKTYELDRVHPKDMATSDYRLAARLHKGIEHMRSQWYYLADEEFSQAIVELNGSNVTLNENVEKLLAEHDLNGLAAKDQFKLLASASTYLLRGFARHQSDDADLQSKAMQDVSNAVKSFKDLGVDNEIVWIAEGYLYIKNDEKDRALSSLNKLKTTPYMGVKEKKLIAEVEEHVKNRDPDKALNYLTDRVIMYKMGMGYLMSYAEEIQWMQLLEKTEYGQMILKRLSELEQTLNNINKYLKFNGLENNSQALLDQLKDKVGE